MRNKTKHKSNDSKSEKQSRTKENNAKVSERKATKAKGNWKSKEKQNQ